MKIRTTMLVGLAAIVAMIAISSTLGLSLVLDTEQRFRQLASELPIGNQTANLSQLSIGEALVISMFDGSQTELRLVLLQAADETLTGDPRTAPSLVILVASVAGSFVAGILLAQRTSRPIQKLLLIAKAVARGKYDSPDIAPLKPPKETGVENLNAREAVSKLGKDELSQLFNTLGEINQKLREQQRELQDSNELLSRKNKELADANEKLKALDRMKTDFINIAAHEIRNPIQPLLGCTAMVKKGLVSNEEGWELVEKQTRMLKNLAESILDVSRIENGVFSYKMEPMDLNKLASEVVSSFAVTSAGLEIRANLEPGESCIIMGDEKRMTQVLTNLITNSIKFTKKGTITAFIRLVEHGDGNQVELKLTDTGRGIPTEILPVVFEKFVTKTDADGNGTGLGLFITKSIIEAHHGQIKAENNVDGIGATITITLPQLQSDITVHRQDSDRVDALGA